MILNIRFNKLSSHDFFQKTNKTHSGQYTECILFNFGRSYGLTILFRDLLTFIKQGMRASLQSLHDSSNLSKKFSIIMQKRFSFLKPYCCKYILQQVCTSNAICFYCNKLTLHYLLLHSFPSRSGPREKKTDQFSNTN